MTMVPWRAAPILADREDDAVLESRIQVALEQVGRFHDMHVAVHESQSILHRALLWFLTAIELSRLMVRPQTRS